MDWKILFMISVYIDYKSVCTNIRHDWVRVFSLCGIVNSMEWYDMKLVGRFTKVIDCLLNSTISLGISSSIYFSTKAWEVSYGSALAFFGWGPFYSWSISISSAPLFCRNIFSGSLGSVEAFGIFSTSSQNYLFVVLSHSSLGVDSWDEFLLSKLLFNMTLCGS